MGWRCFSTKASLTNSFRMIQQNKHDNIKYWPIQKIIPGYGGPDQESEERKVKSHVNMVYLNDLLSSDLWYILNSLYLESMNLFQPLSPKCPHTEKLRAFCASLYFRTKGSGVRWYAQCWAPAARGGGTKTRGRGGWVVYLPSVRCFI